MSKITKITQFIIEDQRVYNNDPSYPEEGSILYEGFFYNFIMSHKTETGYQYKVYDHDYNPVHFFCLALNGDSHIEIV